MQEKGMQTVWKMIPKGSQNESQNPSKITKILKKGMPKTMPDFDPKNDPEMSYKGTKGGAPGGKEGKPPKAALRYLASLIRNAWHRPVSADCSSGRPPTPWDPGCWSDYFYTRNWRTLVETSVTGAKKGIQKRHAKFKAEKVVNINAKRLPKWR